MKVVDINNQVFILAIDAKFTKGDSYGLKENLEYQKSTFVLRNGQSIIKRSGIYQIIKRGSPHNFYDIKIINHELILKVLSGRYTFDLLDCNLYLIDKTLDRKKKLDKI